MEGRFGWKRRIGVVLTALVLLGVAAGTLWAEVPSAYEEGWRFGVAYRSEVAGNLAVMHDASVARGIDRTAVLSAAREREALFREVLPAKVEWMRGVADGAGVPYEDVLLYNAADRLMTGFVGECTTFVASGKALAGGKGTLIAKNRDLGPNTLSEVAMEEGGTFAATDAYKAAYIDIPQAETAYRFVGSRSAGRWGYGMGINEHQVTVADNDAPTRDELAFDKGLHDNDYVRLVLERAKTAREGVEVLTKLTEKYGQAWNSIIFEIGDPNELWIVEVSGKRWVAKQYRDTFTARSNQFQITDDYDLAAEDLLSFAQSKGWIGKDVTGKINFRAVYGTTELYPEDNENLEDRPAAETLYNTEMRYRRAMELLQGISGRISPAAMLPLVRDHYDTYPLPSGKVLELKQVPYYSTSLAQDERQEWMTVFPEGDTVEVSVFPRAICHHAFEGITAATAILSARPDVPNELGLMLHAYMQPCNSLFIPFYTGASSIDGRYSTPEAGSRFFQISKMAFGAYELYRAPLRIVFDPYEASLFKDMETMEKEYLRLKKDGADEEAQALLDEFLYARWDSALAAADEGLTRMLEAAAASSAWSR